MSESPKEGRSVGGSVPELWERRRREVSPTRRASHGAEVRTDGVYLEVLSSTVKVMGSLCSHTGPADRNRPHRPYARVVSVVGSSLPSGQ